MSEIEQFRQRTRAWLEANCPASMRTPMPEDEVVWGGRNIEFKHPDQRIWFERMREKGWFCPDWPRAYGGGGLDPQQVTVLEQEMRRLNCRPPQINLGIWMLGPVLLEFASEAHKQRFLPPMARGEIRWCQGFSEPNAGSDLASLRTSAREEGDHFVVNGGKIWTSYGHRADWMYALVRTGPQQPKHAGISLIVLDMAAPGVSVKPIDLISGKSSFCQVFFDNVRVPKDQVIGEVNGGWALAKALLQHERRAMSRIGEFSLPNHFDLMAHFKTYLPQAQTPGEIALHQRALACAMEAQTLSLHHRRVMEAAHAGQDVSGMMAISKLVHSEQERDKFELLLDVMGQRALGAAGAGFEDRELALTRAWLDSFTQTIAGGSSEVQLNVIAKRVLGLPGVK